VIPVSTVNFGRWERGEGAGAPEDEAFELRRLFLVGSLFLRSVVEDLFSPDFADGLPTGGSGAFFFFAASAAAAAAAAVAAAAFSSLDADDLLRAGALGLAI
jgi:hypothetical protein